MQAYELEVERNDGQISGFTVEFPKVKGGVCDFCGVIDPNQPSTMQYKLCTHYRGKQLACSYCPPSKNQDDIIEHSTMRVLQHPENPKKLLVYCDSFNCRKAHEDRFQLSRSV